MAKSDIDDNCESHSLVERNKMVRDLDDGVTLTDKSNDKTIHSGQFMLSIVHGGDDDVEEIPPIAKDNNGFDFDSARKETSHSYMFGPKCINTLMVDASLTKLFECMTLAYSGRLTSPKWKNFKGIKLKVRDKIRLNNIIWREWYMQYIQGQKPSICHFDAPISDKMHMKPEAVVMEGKYWKRRLESVTAEYMKWRMFYKERFSKTWDRDRSVMEEVAIEMEGMEHMTPKDFLRLTQQSLCSGNDQLTIEEDDFNIMDFTVTDTLFSSLNQPFAFPHPKEISQLGNADYIQPGLVQLQPNLDEFMDTLEPLPSLQEMMSFTGTSNKMFNAPQAQGSTAQTLESLSQSQSDLLKSMLYQTPSPPMPTIDMDTSVRLVTSPPPPPTMMTTTKVEKPRRRSREPVLSASKFSAGSQIVLADAKPIVGLNSPASGVVSTAASPSVISLVLNTQPEIQPQQPQPPQQPQLQPAPIQLQQIISQPMTQPVTQLVPQAKTVTIIQNPQLQSLINSLTQGQNLAQLGQAQVIPAAQTQSTPLLHAATVPAGLKYSTTTCDDTDKVVRTKNEHRRASTGSASSRSSKKKERFIIPQATDIPKSRTRNIAPSPPSGTCLAQLLQGSGNYNGLGIKQESPSVCTRAFQPVQPAPLSIVNTTICPTTTSSTFTFSVAQTIGSDVKKNFVLATSRPATGIPVLQVSELAASPATPQVNTVNVSNPGSPQFQVPSPPTDSNSRSRHASNDSTGAPHYHLAESPLKSLRPKADSHQYKEQRRASHITAEQKRRSNIKVGFETLHQLVPALQQNPNSKISKASTLQKGVEYCRKLKQDKEEMHKESDLLKKEIESLNSAISMCQSQLPATGVPVTRQRADHMRDMFDDYVRRRTTENWKFWIFSIIIRSLFDSYNGSVSTASTEDMCRSVLTWLEQNCSLVSLRPTVLNSLRYLSTSTSILNNPSSVAEEAVKAVNQPHNPTGMS